MWWDLKKGDMNQKLDEVADNSIDLIFADLPYAEGDKSGFKSRFINRPKQYKMINEEWDKTENNDIYGLHECVAEKGWKKLRKGGVLALTCSVNNKFWFYNILGVTGKAYKESLTGYDHQFRFLNEVCWHKPNAMPFMMAKKLGRLVPTCEYVLLYSKGIPKSFDYDFLRKDRTIYEKMLVKNEEGQLRDLWLINVDIKNWVNDGPRHPAQKPKRLLERLIKGYTEPGDTILDPCFGSCGIGKIAIENSRNFVGIELGDNYFDQAYSMMKEVYPKGELLNGE